MEGDTYPCSWKKKGKLYVVYLESDDRIRAAHEDFEFACDELCLKICEATGDGEAVLSHRREPPLPDAVAKYSRPALVTLGWNEVAHGEKWQEGLFEGGYCARCRGGVGARTPKPLEAEKLPRRNIGGFDQIMFSPLLLSAELVSLFDDEEVAAFDLLEVRSAGKSKRRFFEVRGDSLLNKVGVIGGKYYNLMSWQCRECGFKAFSCTHPELPDNYRFASFCALSDLPDPLDRAFVIGRDSSKKQICMPIARWDRIKHDPKASGVLADRIYALPDEQVDRDPKVRIEDEAN